MDGRKSCNYLLSLMRCSQHISFCSKPSSRWRKNSGNHLQYFCWIRGSGSSWSRKGPRFSWNRIHKGWYFFRYSAGRFRINMPGIPPGYILILVSNSKKPVTRVTGYSYFLSSFIPCPRYLLLINNSFNIFGLSGYSSILSKSIQSYLSSSCPSTFFIVSVIFLSFSSLKSIL